MTACSSTPKVGIENAGREAIVATMNDEAMPAWVRNSGTKSFYEDGEDLVAIGSSQLTENGRIEAGFRLASLDGVSVLAKAVDVKIEHYAQSASEGADLTSLDLRSLTSESAKVSASGMKPGKKWYERVSVTGADGTPRLETRFWSETRIPKEEYKRALVRAVQESQGKTGLSQRFNEHVQKHFEQMIGSDDRQPSSQSNGE